MAAGLTNADFARLFRKEAKATDEAPSESPDDGNVEAVNPMMQAAMRRNYAEEEAWEEEDEAPRGGLGMAPSHAPAQDEDVVMEEVEDDKKKKARVLSEAELKRKFTWEKHTTGFGLKMMAKMGFTGRLGKDEKGVSATLEVVQRPNQMGLGFGSFKEAGSLKQNKRVEKELKGETYDDKEEEQKQRREREALQEDDSLWRKRKVPTGGRSYRKAADVSHEAHTKKPRNEIILDMRGPDVRVLDQLTDAYVDQGKIDAARPKLGEELIYNVRMVVNLARGRIYDLTQKIDSTSSTLESMRKEARILKAQVETDAVRWARVEEMVAKMKQLESLAAAANESLSVDKILNAMRDIRSCYPREFDSYRLLQVMPSLVIPTLKALVLSADMLNDSSSLFVLRQFQQLQLFLLETTNESDKTTENGYGVLHHIRGKTNSLGDDVYNYILEETLWPGAVQMVNSQWDVERDFTGCAVWLRSFHPHLSSEFVSGFLRQLVIPKLKLECQRWRPDTKSTMMHQWLEPWRRYLDSSSLESLYPEVQLALGNALSQWHPSDLSMIPVITPWRDVWGEAEYAKFTNRYIMRKLIRCLHREFHVDPQNQSLDALRWVLAWQNYVPQRQFVALFEGEFFPKWLRVLRKWVADSPEFAELETWYLGWKKFFAKHNLANESRLIVHFHGALVLLEAAVVRDEDPAYAIPELNRLAPTSYQEALVKTSESEPSEEDRPPTQRESEENKHKQSHGVNLKELVEHLAIENDITFLPKGRHEGQQVYLFGKHHILIEQGVVYVEKSKGNFVPVDVEELVLQ